MKSNNLFFFIIYFSLYPIFGCSISPETKKIDTLITEITQSCNKIHSGNGSYIYKYRNISHLLLSGKNINLVQKTIDKNFNNLKFEDRFISKAAFNNYVFSKDKFKYEFGDSDNNRKYYAIGISDGLKIKSMSFTSSESDSDHTIFDITNYMIKGQIKPGDPEAYDPLFFSNKKILESFSAYKEQVLNLRSITEEKFEGKKYTVIAFGIRNSFEKYYLDPINDYKVFFIKKFVKDFKSNDFELVRIKYQTVDGLLFPEHITNYKVSNGIIMDYQELIFNKDWKLNIVIPENEFDPKSIPEMKFK